MKRILVLSPHPDDESIGCGGTLRKHIVEGDLVQVIFLTSGERGGHGLSQAETKVVREQEAKQAAAILGYSHFQFWHIQNGKLTANKKNVKKLEQKIIDWGPDIIYVTHYNEMHPEHRAAARMVKKAMAGLPDNLKPTVLMYEVWTPLQHMDYIIDISPFIEIKRSAILVHKSQCDVMKFDEAIIGLNRYRGEMHSWPGGDYAEIFLIMKLK